METTDVQLQGPPPRLIVITDLSVAGSEAALLRRIGTLAARAAPGTVVVQLRDTCRPARERLAIGRELRRITLQTGQWLAVNDRLDLAVLLEAEWVHLGERSVSVADARSLMGGKVRISRACHDPSRANSGADAILLSPVIAARKGRDALGPAALARARSAVGAASWVYALGGVSAATAESCLAAGADGVAVIGAALDGSAPEPLLEALKIRRA